MPDLICQTRSLEPWDDGRVEEGDGVDVRRIDLEGADLRIRAQGDWRGFRSGACAKEPETAAWIKRVCGHGSVFFDVGACVGSYALIAAALGSTVHAFEPVAANYAELQANTWLNGMHSLSAWPVACASEAGPLNISLSSTSPGAASHSVGSVSPATGSREPRLIQRAIGVRLDEFVRDFRLPDPTDIKLDVDGGEVEALEGARYTLSRVRSMMVEVSPDTASSVAAILQAAGLEQTGSWPRSGRQSNHLFERPA